jgi:hypothetical protein
MSDQERGNENPQLPQPEAEVRTYKIYYRPQKREVRTYIVTQVPQKREIRTHKIVKAKKTRKGK